MDVTLDIDSIEDYRKFVKIKTLPSYKVTGRSVSFPDEYADLVGFKTSKPKFKNWEPSEWLFDYQKHIVDLAVKKRKFAIFADCGLGKTPMLLEFAQASESKQKRTLIVRR